MLDVDNTSVCLFFNVLANVSHHQLTMERLRKLQLQGLFTYIHKSNRLFIVASNC